MLAKTIVKICFCFTFVFILFGFTSKNAAATVSCGGSTGTLYVKSSQSSTISFSISNSGDEDIDTVEINSPNSDNWTITGASASGWSADISSTQISFTGSTISVGASTDFSVTVTAGSSEVAADSWNIYVSGNGNQVSCGSLNIGIYLYTEPASTTTTTTTTTTRTVTATPLPSPTPDRAPPSINIKTDFSETYKQAPSVEGTASDVSGVSSLEYSIDDGRNWLPVTEVSTLLGRSTSFTVNLPLLFDGSYKLKIRAKDGLGNTGSSKTQFLTIDRLPPRIGATLFTVGPQIIPPHGSIFNLAQGLTTRVYLSAIGGPEEVKLYVYEKGTTKASINPFLMKKNPETGIWLTDINMPAAGNYEISTVSTDGAQNTTERKVADIDLLPKGKITGGDNPLPEAVIAIYFLNPQTLQYELMDTGSYDLANPQVSDQNGEYSFYLPTGNYYLTVGKEGFERIQTNVFSLDATAVINSDFNLKKSGGINIAGLIIPFPKFRSNISPLKLKKSQTVSIAQDSLKGSLFPEFSLNLESGEINEFLFRGSNSLVTFLNTWTPHTFDQLEILKKISGDKRIKTYVFIPQESPRSVEMFTKRGNYGLKIYADRDGDLLEKLNLNYLPAHFLLDKRGVIRNIKLGLLKEAELDRMLLE